MLMLAAFQLYARCHDDMLRHAIMPILRFRHYFRCRHASRLRDADYFATLLMPLCCLHITNMMLYRRLLPMP